MRNAIPITSFKRQQCAGCADTETHTGYRFPGSDAFFCHECATFIDAERQRSGRLQDAIHSPSVELRECWECGETFRINASRNAARCHRCAQEIKKEKACLTNA